MGTPLHYKRFRPEDKSFDIENVVEKIVSFIPTQFMIPEGYTDNGAPFQEWRDEGQAKVNFAFGLRSASLGDGDSPYGKGMEQSASAEKLTDLTNIYSYYASVLNGGEDFDIGDHKTDAMVFISFTKAVTEDGINKGSVSITTYPSGGAQEVNAKDSLYGDYGSVSSSLVSGKTGKLYANPTFARIDPVKFEIGQVFYDHSVIALDLVSAFWRNINDNYYKIASAYESAELWPEASLPRKFLSSTYSSSFDSLVAWLNLIQANNVRKNYMATYFCRGNRNEFNYSTNPTFLSGAGVNESAVIAAKEPMTFITTVGLYNDDNELLAIGKLNKPMQKDLTNDVHITVRVTI